MGSAPEWGSFWNLFGICDAVQGHQIGATQYLPESNISCWVPDVAGKKWQPSAGFEGRFE